MTWKTTRTWLARIIGAAILLVAVGGCKTEKEPPKPPPPPKPSYTAPFLISVLQNLTLEPLGPAGTAVEVLANSPEVVRFAVKRWADGQFVKANDMAMRTAYPERAKWEERIQWFDAVSSCVGGGSCNDLRRIQEAKDRAKRRPSRPPPPPRLSRQGGEAGDADSGDGHP